jgi:Mlc titration factor MtfA (ptsG expression regulator)
VVVVELFSDIFLPMFRRIRHWLNQRIIKRSGISPAQWAQAFAALPLLRGYPDAELEALRELAILFLHRKVFEVVGDFVLTEKMTLVIALQACIPILKLDLHAYAGWVSIIVYPAGFAPERVITDEVGVQHRVRSHLAGEAWQRGPVVLAWDETETAGIIDGHNLVIHEFAHKLDMQSGAANGFPPLHANMKSADWHVAFMAGFEDFQQKCNRGAATEIDCYAATSPAEFFAVFSEVFFERPRIIERQYPAIYAQLCLYYRQNPLLRLSA